MLALALDHEVVEKATRVLGAARLACELCLELGGDGRRLGFGGGGLAWRLWSTKWTGDAGREASAAFAGDTERREIGQLSPSACRLA
jgi:hypothetical protein